MLNGLNEQAWAGIAAIVGVIIGTIGAAIKGAKKTPIEVGLPPPPADMDKYTLEEVRALRREFDDHVAETRKRWDDAEKSWAAVHQDTQVLRDRGRG